MTNNNSGTNPAWKPFLDVLPESLHSLVIPVLKDWDAGIQQKFQEIRSEYAGLEKYKKFVENEIDPAYAEQAIILADELQRNPAKIAQQINATFNLGLVPQDQLGQDSSRNGESNDDFSEFDANDDIFKDPRVKAMKETLERLENEYKTDKEREEEEAAAAEFEEYLNELESKYTDANREGGPLPFDRMFVTALISQGLDGDAAVEHYHKALAQHTVNNPPPANNSDSGSEPPQVMGGDGNVGSGQPDGSVNIGSLSKNDLNSTVEQMLARSLEQGN